MKIALMADTHYGVRNDNHVFYEYQKKSNEFYFQKFKDAGITTVVHLGDLVDRRKYLNYVTADRLRKDLLDPLSQFDTHIICGNHDVYYKNTNDVNALDTLLGNYDFKVYLAPEEIELAKTKVLMLPWINGSNESESLNLVKSTAATLCLGHLEISGFEMESGRLCDHGLEYGLFEKFNLVVSGHFHHKSHYGPVNYMGAAYEFTWADFNDPKGCAILDLETMNMEHIRNPHSIFKVYRYDDVHAMDSIKNDLENKDWSSFKDNYVKIFVENKESPYTFDLVLDAIYNATPIDIKISDNMNYLVDDMDEIDEVEDTTQIMNKYIDAMSLEANKTKKVKSLMTELYQEAISLENVE